MGRQYKSRATASSMCVWRDRPLRQSSDPLYSVEHPILWVQVHHCTREIQGKLNVDHSPPNRQSQERRMRIGWVGWLAPTWWLEIDWAQPRRLLVHRSIIFELALLRREPPRVSNIVILSQRRSACAPVKRRATSLLINGASARISEQPSPNQYRLIIRLLHEMPWRGRPETDETFIFY